MVLRKKMRGRGELMVTSQITSLWFRGYQGNSEWDCVASFALKQKKNSRYLHSTRLWLICIYSELHLDDAVRWFTKHSINVMIVVTKFMRGRWIKKMKVGVNLLLPGVHLRYKKVLRKSWKRCKCNGQY